MLISYFFAMLLVLVTSIQLYLHFGYLFRISWAKAYLNPTLPTEGVSIVIAARNEASNLPALLEMLCRQDYPLFEIIVVDDRSTDESRQILTFYQQKYAYCHAIHITSTPSRIQPKKYALSQGIAQAKYDWILLTDGDCIPASIDWVRLMMQTRRQGSEVVLGIAPYNSGHGGLLNEVVQYETFYTALQYVGFALAGKPYMGVGRNLLYAKALFAQTKGFERHASVVGGDDDLFVNSTAHAGNTVVCWQARSYTYSDPPLTWRDWLRQKTRHLSVGKHYKQADKWRLGALYASQGFGWLLGLWACLAYQETALLLWLGRCIIIWVGYAFIIKRLHFKLSFFVIPCFDFLFPLYIFTVGMIATLRKKKQWKN